MSKSGASHKVPRRTTSQPRRQVEASTWPFEQVVPQSIVHTSRWAQCLLNFDGYSAYGTQNGIHTARNAFSDCAAATAPSSLHGSTGYYQCICRDGIGGHPAPLRFDRYGMWVFRLLPLGRPSCSHRAVLWLRDRRMENLTKGGHRRSLCFGRIKPLANVGTPPIYVRALHTRGADVLSDRHDVLAHAASPKRA